MVNCLSYSYWSNGCYHAQSTSKTNVLRLQVQMGTSLNYKIDPTKGENVWKVVDNNKIQKW